MALARRTSVRIDQAKLTRAIERALESPKARAYLARVANDESRKMVVIAEQVTEEELNRRPDDRRTDISRAHGKEVHDSFVIIPADTSNPTKVRAGITNTHPAFGIIEGGSPPHEIAKQGGGTLRFPFDGGAAPRGGIVGVLGKAPQFRKGVKGSFPIEVTSENAAYRKVVSHPGTAARRILERTADRYRKSTRANVRARSTR